MVYGQHHNSLLNGFGISVTFAYFWFSKLFLRLGVFSRHDRVDLPVVKFLLAPLRCSLHGLLWKSLRMDSAILFLEAWRAFMVFPCPHILMISMVGVQRSVPRANFFSGCYAGSMNFVGLRTIGGHDVFVSQVRHFLICMALD